MKIKFNDNCVLIVLRPQDNKLDNKVIKAGEWYPLAGASDSYYSKGERMVDITFDNGETACQVYRSAVVIED